MVYKEQTLAFTKQVRNYRMQVRLSDNERNEIESYCNKRKCKVSDFIRVVALDYIKNHKEE